MNMEQRFLVRIENSGHDKSGSDMQESDVVVRRDGDDYLVTIDGNQRRVSLTGSSSGGGSSLALIDGRSYQVDVQADRTKRDGSWSVFAFGRGYDVRVQNFRLAQLRKRLGVNNTVTKSKALKAPMPGLVLQVAVSVGDSVKAGDTVMVLEAMKMENPIKSSGAGIVSKVHVQPTDSVEKGAALIEFAD
jgi:biotin carboxyl carrier protein